MKQVVQSFRNGQLIVEEVPVCKPGTNQILVKTYSSVVSAGTERAIAEFSQQSLLGKARSRPDLVRQVMQKVKTDGLISAAKASLSKLDMPLALGYSSSGVVLDVGGSISSVSVGDRVACAGMGYASHAEVVVVPKNLFVKVPDAVTDEEAAYATIGAIALQGVRITDVRLGERVVVIGLGLIGLITVQLLKASGCLVLGADLDPGKINLALELGADAALIVGDSLIEGVAEFTQGRGADAVIISAATSSNQPVELAGEISRLKGRVVVVGDVKMDIPRRIYYNKELALRLSMSYGPGRYDPQYEEKGIDYPYAYVPFTEQRNMENFLQLVKERKVTPARLITHRFSLEDAEKAYRLIKGETGENFLGVVFTYRQEPMLSSTVRLKEQSMILEGSYGLHVGMIGAGNYAKQMLLPNIKNLHNTHFVGIATSTGISGRHTGEKYGFHYCTTDYTEILRDANVNAVVVATRHNTHAVMTVKALEAGKHVFVEKPLATSEEELGLVMTVAEAAKKHVLVGFNRRFSPLGQQVRGFFAGHNQPLCMLYRVNAGFIPHEHWIQDSEEGGGRVIGEVCHFVDFLQYICGSKPVAVSACGINSGTLSAEDHLTVTIRFADGSIGSIHYFANGDKVIPKEYIEIYGEGKIAQIDDFCKGRFTHNGNTKRVGGRRQDKGQKGLLQAFHHAVLSGGPTPIPLEESVLTTLTTFRIIEALKSRNMLRIRE